MLLLVSSLIARSPVQPEMNPLTRRAQCPTLRVDYVCARDAADMFIWSRHLNSEDGLDQACRLVSLLGLHACRFQSHGRTHPCYMRNHQNWRWLAQLALRCGSDGQLAASGSEADDPAIRFWLCEDVVLSSVARLRDAQPEGVHAHVKVKSNHTNVQ